MNYGFICFAYSKNEWIAKQIAWFTKSQWSHSFITAPPMLGRELAMEAGGGGVELVTFDDAYRNNPNQNYEVYKFNCDQEQINSSIYKCLDELETSYGLLQYPWFMWRSLNKLFGRDIKGQDNWSQKGIVCSGFARHFITYAGFGDLFFEFGKSAATAQDVYNVVKNHPKLFELIEKKDG